MSITIEQAQADKTTEIAAYIRKELIAHNRSQSDIDKEEPVVLSVRNDDGAIIAGVSATLWGECLEIELLWVSQKHRGQGIGSRLLLKLEDIAKNRGCKIILTDTYSFQAPDFYLKLGYVECFTIGGYSNGDVSKMFLLKEINQ